MGPKKAPGAATACADVRNFAPASDSRRVIQNGSFIPQRFDGMEVGGAEGGRQSAQKANDQEDDGGDPDGAQGNVEVDVAFAGGVFIERTVEGQGADGGGQAVGEQDAQDAAHDASAPALPP